MPLTDAQILAEGFKTDEGILWEMLAGLANEVNNLKDELKRIKEIAPSLEIDNSW